MTRLALLQQQSAPIPIRGLFPIGDCWQWWDAPTIARITNTPVWAVESDWPIIWAALEVWGCADYNTVRVALATIAIETAHTFKPVQEAFWLDDQWRWENLRYAPYWGRGYVQLTWEDNYRYYGWKIGDTSLVDFPDKALVPLTAAQLLGAYFSEVGIPAAAADEDWAACRRKVQGGLAGYADFLEYINGLDAARTASPLRLTEVLARGYTRLGDPYVWDGEVPGAFDCSGYVSWCYWGRVTSYTDDIYGETTAITRAYPGDIVLYEYYDPFQPNTRFPHVGLWLNDRETLDARDGYGVGVHPHVVGAKLWLRRVPGVQMLLPRAA